MSVLTNTIWAEKYAPATIDEYIFHDEHLKHKIIEVIEKGTLPHILLSGQGGSGKTAIANILLRTLDINDGDIRIINASDENSVDVVREKVRFFAETAALGEYKVIVLDEFDFLSTNAQAALRKTMVDNSTNCRFIVICNYLYKVMPEIISRCTYKFHFKSPDKNDIAELLVKILTKEKITFTLDAVDDIISKCYPDIRNCINTIQEYSVNGQLLAIKEVAGTVDYQSQLIESISNNDWVSARKIVCENVIKDEYEALYRLLYDNIHLSSKFKQREMEEEAILIISEHEYRNAIVADPEINAAAMLIKLTQLN